MYLYSQPFPYKPDRTLHYSIDSLPALDRLHTDPELTVYNLGDLATLTQISIGDLNVPVSPTTDFTLKEMAILGLISVGATSHQTKEVFPATQKGEAKTAKDNLFCALNVTAAEGAGCAQAVGLAYKRGLLLPDPRAAEKTLDTLGHITSRVDKSRFKVLAELLAEGLTTEEMIDIVDFTESKKTLQGTYYRICNDMDIKRAEFVMVAGALGMIPADEEPTFSLLSPEEQQLFMSGSSVVYDAALNHLLDSPDHHTLVESAR